jgi:hypothetical protein
VSALTGAKRLGRRPLGAHAPSLLSATMCSGDSPLSNGHEVQCTRSHEARGERSNGGQAAGSLPLGLPALKVTEERHQYGAGAGAQAGQACLEAHSD